MKGKALPVLIAVLVCMCASCGSSVNVFDDTVPAERSATLNIDSAFTIKSYNDIPVKLKKKFLGMGYTGFTILPGRTTLVMDLRSGRIGNTYYRANNISFSYNFETGKEYVLRFWFTNAEGKVGFLGAGSPSVILYEGKKINNDAIVFAGQL